MIIYNPKDFNLNLIYDQLKDLDEKNPYYLYGLKKENPVFFELKWKDNIHVGIFNKVLKFMDFCYFNNLVFRYKRNDNFKTKKQFKQYIHIGLNYKLREYPHLCELLVKSLVYLLEDRIKYDDFNSQKIIKNMPKFEVDNL